MSDTTIEVLAHEERVFNPPQWFSKRAHIKSMEEYQTLYRQSVEDMEGFWHRMAEQTISWYKRWDRVVEWDFHRPHVAWFIGGRLNASYNCIDRHLEGARRNKAALIWEGDDGATRTLTYQQLYYEVNRFSRVLKALGIGRGDRVTIYMPMIPELPIAMLACARIGAIHSVVFGGFSPASLRERINDCGAKLLITADEGLRGGKTIALKKNADIALKDCPSVEHVVVVRRTGGAVDFHSPRDIWWHEAVAEQSGAHLEPAQMDSEDPLFILYTSGSTGKPKGVVHTTGGYMVYVALTFKWVFDYHEEDIYFCTADIGWVTGHSYIVYGPLACGATALIFEGIPTHPAPDRFWQIVDKHGVNILYTAPTAIRALMRFGDQWVKKHDLSTLRLLGTVGEPINPEAWMWYHQVVGRGRLPIVDTWWQTETGGIMITPLPGATPLKPGSAGKPFFGIVPKILDEEGRETKQGGYLVIERPWPGMLRGMFGDRDNQRLREVYFSRFPGYYMSGDGATVDDEGFWWLMGRIDDVLNVSGHRLGTAEIESALVAHPAVAEAAVVGFPHPVKGEGIYAFVVLKGGVEPEEGLKEELIEHIKEAISPIAKPDKIQFATGLPKTRSGKIMRRVLRKIARGDTEDMGDLSTLADPEVVKHLLEGRV